MYICRSVNGQYDGEDMFVKNISENVVLWSICTIV